MKLRLAKHIKSMQSLHQLFNKWKISSKWILSHCLSYSLNISSTNKKFRRLSNFTEPYLDGFIIPNVPKTQVIDWLPAVVQSDDALYPVVTRSSSSSSSSSWDDVDVDEVDDDVDKVDNDESDLATTGEDAVVNVEDEDILGRDDIDAITSSSSFAFSPSTTEPSKFVLHSSNCKCIKESMSSSTSTSSSSTVSSSSYWSSSPCKELISSDPFRPIIESILIKSNKFGSNSGSGSAAIGICPIASSYLYTSRAKEDGERETFDSIGPEGADDDDTCPEIWMKNIQQEITDDDNNNPNESHPNNNRYKIYHHLYKEYAALFKATHKRFHLKILEELYYIQRQKRLRSLILLRHGTDEENKTAKFLWIEPSSSFTTNINNDDQDIGELKNFPSFIHAFPIKDLSKSVLTRPHNNKINIETHIKLFNGTTKQYNKDFDSTWWTANSKSNQRKRKYQENNANDDDDPRSTSNKVMKH